MLSNTVRNSLLPAFGRPSARRAIPANLQDHAAVALAEVIATSRQRSIAEGVRPVPGAIARSLQGYFPDALLRKCRFVVGTAGPLRLPALRLSYGEAAAMTLVDVVVFANDRAAQSDLRLWAQHLTHVMQFQRWGIEEFARRYVRDRTGLEQEAAATTTRFLAWQRRRDPAT